MGAWSEAFDEWRRGIAKTESMSHSFQAAIRTVGAGHFHQLEPDQVNAMIERFLLSTDKSNVLRNRPTEIKRVDIDDLRAAERVLQNSGLITDVEVVDESDDPTELTKPVRPPAPD